jgi:hypothetical protein
MSFMSVHHFCNPLPQQGISISILAADHLWILVAAASGPNEEEESKRITLSPSLPSSRLITD